MTAYDWGKVSRETLERLAKTTHELSSAIEDPSGYHDSQPLMQARIDAIRAARAEALVPPLRTRAEVDAEIAEIVREYVRDVGARDAFGSMERDRQKLLALVAEPLAPEIDPLHPTGRCSCAGEGECAWCIVACPGCSFRRCDCQCDPEVCSCEESERLKARVRELENEVEQRKADCRVEFGAHESTIVNLTARRAELAALQKRIDKAVAVLSTGQCRNCCPEALRFLRD